MVKNKNPQLQNSIQHYVELLLILYSTINVYLETNYSILYKIKYYLYQFYFFNQLLFEI